MAYYEQLRMQILHLKMDFGNKQFRSRRLSQLNLNNSRRMEQGGPISTAHPKNVYKHPVRAFANVVLGGGCSQSTFNRMQACQCAVQI